MDWTWLFGVAGYLGFEGLRLYRCIWEGLPLIRKSRRPLYIFAMLLVAAFAGVVAYLLANGDNVKALFVGFAVPNGLKGLVVFPKGRANDTIDDIHVTKRNPFWEFLSWMDEFFRYPR